MSAPALRRGSVVLRGRKYGVVWAVQGRLIELRPVLVPRTSWAHDVELSLPELVAAGIPIGGAAIRCALRLIVPAADQVHVGELPGPLACRMVQAIIRAASDESVRARWGGEREHRAGRLDGERCVKLVG